MKMKHFLLIPIALSLFASIAYRSMNQAITSSGISAATSYRANASISAFLTVLLVGVYISFIYIDKTQEETVQRSELELDKKEKNQPNKKDNFKKEIHNILSKLMVVVNDGESERVCHNAEIATRQIIKIDKYIDGFNNLYIGENVNVCDSVAVSLDVAKQQFIQNSKSIVNRIIIEGCEDEIENRVASNQKIIEEVKILLNETVNYLDNKTTTSSNTLENITSSLKIFNETTF